MGSLRQHISIVIPVRNEGERLSKAIRSFIHGRQEKSTLEFVIVDDASTDGCCENLDLQPVTDAGDINIKIVRLPEWSGIPLARNAGADAATGQILLITDANVQAGPGWDKRIWKEIGEHTALCGTIADAASQWRGYGCRLLPSMGVQWLTRPNLFGAFAPIAPSACTVITTDLFRRLGGYDTELPVYGAAEAEFSLRLWLYVGTIKKVPELVLQHHFKGKSERSPFLKQIREQQMHNYLRFGLLYLHDADLAQLFRHWHSFDHALFNKVFPNLPIGAIAARRRHLEALLPKNFDWYRSQFSF